MATILTSTIPDVDVSKLKGELEALANVKVQEIAPKDGVTDTTVTLTQADGVSDLLAGPEAAAQAIIDAHVDNQDEDLKFLARNESILGNKELGTIEFYNNSVSRWRIDASHDLLPVSNASYNIGSSALRVNSFFAVTGNLSGNLTVSGDLTVLGTTTSLDSVNLEVEDNQITLNKNFTTGVPTLDGGLLFLRGDEPNAQINWNEAEDRWEVGFVGSMDTIASFDDLTDHINDTANPHLVTKAQVGLSDVTNDEQLKKAAGDIDSFADKAVPVSADIFLIEDSDDAFNKKKLSVSQFTASLLHQSLSGAGTNTHAQIDSHISSATNPHSVTKTQVGLSDVTNDEQLKRAAADFVAFASKAVPTVDDILLIEDNADANNKKQITIGDLPFANSGLLDGYPLTGTPSGGDTLSFNDALSQWDYVEEGIAKKLANDLGAIEIDTTSVANDDEYLRYNDSTGKIEWAAAPGVSSSGPIGAILPFGGSTPPQGFLFCDGAAVSRVFYQDLFDVIGTTFGVGDGVTTFNLPDMRQKFPLGKAVSGTGDTLGGTGGAIDHTHIGGTHTHDMSAHTHIGGLHTHDLSNHTHSIPAHYHGMGAGATLSISGSGSHLHKIGDFQSTVSSGVDQTVISIGSGDSITDTFSDSEVHSHTSGDFTGSIGLVTGGVDGNTSMVSGLPSNNTSGGDGTVSTSGPSINSTGPSAAATDSNNPPYLVVNYAIKYSDNILASGTTAISNDIAFNGITSQQTHTNFSNSEKVSQTFAAQTTSATPATAFTLSVPDNSVLWISVNIVARYENTSANQNYAAKIFGGVRRNNASSAVLIDQAAITELSDENPSGYIVDLDVNGNDLRVRVTGATGETVNWAGSIEHQAVSLAV